MFKKLAWSFALVLLALCSYASQDGSVALAQFKGTALVELEWLAKEAPEHGAIIFKAGQSKGFVQFSGPELSLDLPQGILSESQLAKATAVLLPAGVETFSYPLGRGSSQTMAHSFYKNFEGDLNEASSVVLLIFRKVFELDDAAVITVERIQ